MIDTASFAELWAQEEAAFDYCQRMTVIRKRVARYIDLRTRISTERAEEWTARVVARQAAASRRYWALHLTVRAEGGLRYLDTLGRA